MMFYDSRARLLQMNPASETHARTASSRLADALSVSASGLSERNSTRLAVSNDSFCMTRANHSVRHFFVDVAYVCASMTY